jgi:ribokinase
MRASLERIVLRCQQAENQDVMDGRVVVVGSSNTDMTVTVPKLPGPGETVLGGWFATAAGGKGANQAVAAARAGAAVELVACVGDDTFGEEALQGFAEAGVGTDFVARTSEAPSGVALIVVDEEGENSIAVAPGANAKLRPEHVERAEGAIASAEVLVAQLEIPLETVQAAVERAAAHGARIVLNPAPAQSLGEEMYQHVSFLTPNESEAKQLAGRAGEDDVSLRGVADELLSKGVEAVLITLGARGVLVATPDRREQIDGIAVDAVDTTAAGDVFNGALATALSDGKTVSEAARFANAAAALSVTRAGAQPSAPGREDILAFWEEGG